MFLIFLASGLHGCNWMGGPAENLIYLENVIPFDFYASLH